MKRNVFTISICLILMMILSLYAVTAMAVGEEIEDLSSQETTSDNTSSEVISSEDASSDISNDEGVSSEETSSVENESSEEQTSSAGTTSSKPSSNKPGGATFIDETGSVVSTPQVQSDINEGDEALYDEDLGVEEEIEFYEGGRVVTMSSLVTKNMWIPILISILCIGALIYVNVSFKLKFATGRTSSSNRRSKSTSAKKASANRRKVK